jgi:hypothetical protein
MTSNRQRVHARTTIDIDATPFIRSHMRNPRGLGSWAFATDPNPRIEDVMFTPFMTYREAKAWAKTWFHEQQKAGVFPSFLPHATLYAQP